MQITQVSNYISPRLCLLKLTTLTKVIVIHEYSVFKVRNDLALTSILIGTTVRCTKRIQKVSISRNCSAHQ
jgi:hypothetical protein